MTEFPNPENLSCFGTARILVEQLGGPEIARIYKIQIHIIGEEEPHEHAYVVVIFGNIGKYLVILGNPPKTRQDANSPKIFSDA